MAIRRPPLPGDDSAEQARFEVAQRPGDEGELVLVARGAWDFTAEQTPRRGLVQQVEHTVELYPAVRVVVLDMTRVSVVDSSGLSILILVARYLRTTGAVLRVRPDDHLRWRLGVTGLDRLVEVV